MDIENLVKFLKNVENFTESIKIGIEIYATENSREISRKYRKGHRK